VNNLKEKLMSGVIMPQGTITQTLVAFNSAAIENGFILTKTYIIQEGNGRPPVQTQRSTFYPTLGDVVKSLSDDVA
jgi:hypothetical protein